MSSGDGADGDSTAVEVRPEVSHFLDLLDEDASEEDREIATLFFRKYSCRYKSIAPLEVFVDLVKGLIISLRSPLDTTRLDAAWALTNFACESHDACDIIIDLKGVIALSACARDTRGEVQDQAFWAIGNIASDCHLCRNEVRATDALRTMVSVLEALIASSAPFPVFSFNLLWALSQTLRSGILNVPIQLVRRALVALTKLLGRDETPIVKSEAAMCIAHLADDHLNGIVEVLQTPNMLSALQSLLSDIQTVHPGLRAIGNIVAGDDNHTQAVIDAGTLPLLVKVYNQETSSEELHRQLLWIFSNVAAGTPQQIDELFELDGLVTIVFEASFSHSHSKRCEAGWVIVNALAGSELDRMKWLCSRDMLRALGSVMTGRITQRLQERILNSLQVVLQRRPNFITLLRKYGIMDAVHVMASDSNPDIAARALDIEAVEEERLSYASSSCVYNFR